MSKNKKLTTAILSVCLSLALLLTALFAELTLAWFSNNNNVQASGMGINIAEQNGVSLRSYSIYKRDGGGASRVASSNDASQNVQMTEFDPIFTDRNVNTPLIIRLEIEDIPASNPEITVSTTASGTLYDEEKSDAFKTILSNIVGVRVAQIPAGDIDLNTIEDTQENADVIYSGVVEYFSSKEPNAFVSYDQAKSEYTKEKTMAITISDYTPKDDRTLVIYIEIDYITSLVSAFVDTNGIEINDTSSGAEDMILFSYDISPFVINYDNDD